MTTGDEDVSLKNILQHQNRLLEWLIGQSSGTATNIESWSNYAEQLEHHFKSQGVEKDVQKKQFLLYWVGPESYQLINQLNAGQTIEDVSFAQILQLLTEHLVKPTHAIASRYDFMQCTTNENEKYSERLARLKEKARNCHFYNQTIFTEKQAIDDRIKYHIVMNIPHSSVRNSSLQMDSPTLDEVLRVCNTHELIQSRNRIMSSKDQEGQVEALRSKQEIEEINALRKNADIQPRSFYRNQSRPIYRDTYAIGSCKVMATLNERLQILWVTVLDTVGQPLFGRTWISAFNIEWPNFITHANSFEYNSKQLESIELIEFTLNNDHKIRDLLDCYSGLFKPSTTCVKNFEVKLTLNADAIPQCWRSRRVPFAMRKAVETELNRQLKLGIIGQVDTVREHVDWDAPVVIVRKPDGSVRICGDFRVTINLNLRLNTYILPTFDDVMAKILGGELYSILDIKDAYLQLGVE
ncbi:hypothetical protein GJ496_006737 [Pomphorhynchus laevis]|nr:hypothetical protein GJ496_006737 [Pomphorhynchus laevis]